MTLSDATRQRIQSIVDSDRVVLFMKGNRRQPQCGFSAQVVAILDRALGGADYTTVDVLQDAEIRQGIKDFAEWPTIPQLYLKGEFLGGCDIVTEMYQSGELEEQLRKAEAR